ncbi:MAG: heavy-metal-associated domain-containing protein [Ignavibacteriales bacterium]|nr:heavy-metal-associated domain-containing protein [Ignavibacteriales bacterium]
MKTYQLIINGMNCGHCVNSLKKELLKIPNIKVNDVRVGSAVVELEESNTTKEILTKAIETAGYDVVSIQ